MPYIVMHGPSVSLAVLTEEFLVETTSMINDLEVTVFLTTLPPKYEKKEAEWIESLANSHTNKVFVVLKNPQNDEKFSFVGIIGIHSIDWRSGTADTGAVFINSMCNKGYGSEAKMLQLHYAFNVLGLRKICSSVVGFNPRSKRYLEKAGYREEATLSAQVFHNGTYWDEHLIAIFRKEWEPLWVSFKKEHSLPY